MSVLSMDLPGQATMDSNTRSSSSNRDNEIQSLKEEMERLSAQIVEASTERAQAAEYGLVLLEEKQALQVQQEELNSLYESTKRELESTATAFRQVQDDYEKRIREVEGQREQLLEEMEVREGSLVGKVSQLEERSHQLERKLKKSVSEQDCLNQLNNRLTRELERYKKEHEVMKEDNSKLKEELSGYRKYNKELQKSSDKMQVTLDSLMRYKEQHAQLQEANESLKQETISLQDQFESILVEKQDLEVQNFETVQALNEEREAKDVLVTRLRDVTLKSPTSPSWADEKKKVSFSFSDRGSILKEERSLNSTGVSELSSPVANGMTHPHSTPSATKDLVNEVVLSLQTELQQHEDSIMELPSSSSSSSSNSAELEQLRRKNKEGDEMATALQAEKQVLEERLTLSAKQHAEELERVKLEYCKSVSEQDHTTKTAQEDIAMKEELLNQLRDQLTTSSARKVSLEIEVEGLKDEMDRLRKSTSSELHKLQSECTQEQNTNAELLNRVDMLQEQVNSSSAVIENLERILFNSCAELSTMGEGLRNLHKTVQTLSTADRAKNESQETSPPIPSPVDVNLPGVQKSDDGSEPNRAVYSLKLSQVKSPVHIHKETNSLLAVVQLHEQLRSIRSPLEKFTRTMLQRSLAHSAKHMETAENKVPPIGGGVAGGGSGGKNATELEAAIGKWKSKLAHKVEEVSNLRAIMKARATTADVAISSLKSKLEGQARTYQTELTRLKYQVKSLKKERDELSILRAMYAQRCEEYINQVSEKKKSLDKLMYENGQLSTYLRITIEKKLELSKELEEYRILNERVHQIPKLLPSSRV